ncbi:DEHA2E24376p [Debaryomyces hansenii CBS767]|uniref:DEHA2E24376p n=1 Tax=Debaryomyces hansenii (strain ATCC 36239 / CBS 767 / BCRC 21394 / JCM 1990 / NBRC 0083 / IGC 2968) TaxID=284592 RepID=B5RU70_DEBHA|nr:DEHA2E24376p [Debaryomyces hansenii CBS767]CAR65882.1 DEHA2E24376p [Debaryomyces hansenii CBS767]|eukprot:XP_002770542.1 DEHA2E24376p [Debaryomyces hansenii CBS767]
MVSFGVLSSIALSSAYFFDHAYAHKVVNSTPISSRDTVYSNAKRSLTRCEEKLLHPDAMKRRQEKRDRFINGHKKKKRARDTGYPPLISKRADNSSSLFEDVSCILSPEVTIGPYYVEGEYVRDDITEDQDGVDLLLDVQLIDVNTCEPVPQSYIDVWHCNSTGVYSGVSEEDTLGSTFLRGIWPTDDDGIMQMKTKFPGWYVSRATHIHITAHQNATVLSNNTISGGDVNHIGQIFFNQTLLDEVALLEPYVSNQQSKTSNTEDSIYQEENSNGYDAIMNIEYLGSEISAGLLGYITIGVNTTANYDDEVIAAATFS